MKTKHFRFGLLSGCSWSVLGPFESLCSHSWRLSGRSRATVGSLLGRCGATLARLDHSLAALVAPSVVHYLFKKVMFVQCVSNKRKSNALCCSLCRSWAALEQFLSALGMHLDALGALLAALGPLLSARGCSWVALVTLGTLGCSGGTLGRSWCVFELYVSQKGTLKAQGTQRRGRSLT